MIRQIAAAVFLASLAAVAQPQEPLQFDVASVRPSQPGREVIEPLPGSLTMRNVRMRSCIAWAYDLEEDLIQGPDWTGDAWFDILAKPAAPANASDLREMLQALLAARFHLEQHRETKEISALILTVGKNGSKLQPTDTEGSPSFKTGKANLTGQGATVAQLTHFLSHELHMPIVDRTGLTGRYNYFLDVNAYLTEEIRKSPGTPPEAASIVAQAVQAQLGLKLDAKKAPVEVLVIDRLDKTPTEN
jgi:uncharacterized protein (TIGR03435 family)